MILATIANPRPVAFLPFGVIGLKHAQLISGETPCPLSHIPGGRFSDRVVEQADGDRAFGPVQGMEGIIKEVVHHLLELVAIKLEQRQAVIWSQAEGHRG